MTRLRRFRPFEGVATEPFGSTFIVGPRNRSCKRVTAYHIGQVDFGFGSHFVALQRRTAFHIIPTVDPTRECACRLIYLKGLL